MAASCMTEAALRCIPALHIAVVVTDAVWGPGERPPSRVSTALRAVSTGLIGAACVGMMVRPVATRMQFPPSDTLDVAMLAMVLSPPILAYSVHCSRYLNAHIADRRARGFDGIEISLRALLGNYLYVSAATTALAAACVFVSLTVEEVLHQPK